MPIANQKSKIHNALVECVPNFSEGRKPEVVEQIARAIASADDTTVLNRHIDPDHNRSVITFVAPLEKIVEGALRAVAKAAELIDLRQHGGEHPRIGATDVLPFVPVSGVTIDDCVALAHEAGKRIWKELSIPVYFYERAALRSDRARLEHVRGKGFEKLLDEIVTNPDRKPDVGEARLHPSAGAGLLIGTALVMPGDMTRADALKSRGMEAVRLIVGCIPLLVVAGIIEGFISPAPINPLIKFAIAGITGVALYLYLFLAGRGEGGNG